jgi:2-methylisocitrate lyase-like PEP mutase family enzyme
MSYPHPKGTVMMNLAQKAAEFAKLHVKGAPLRLYNAWDAGSAKRIADAGAKAIATSSWAVAAAQGHQDGEDIPLKLVEEIVGRIVRTTELPVTVDFEGGYSDDDHALSENIKRLLAIGVAGINFEDRVVHGKGLYSPERQARRVAAIRKAADQASVPLFINARSDVFFGSEPDHALLFNPAQERAVLYAQAGASGFFAPGLVDASLIERLCVTAPLPVNVMMMKGLPPVQRLAELGVARISYGNMPYVDAMKHLGEGARAVFSAA